MLLNLLAVKRGQIRIRVHLRYGRRKRAECKDPEVVALCTSDSQFLVPTIRELAAILKTDPYPDSMHLEYTSRRGAGIQSNPYADVTSGCQALTTYPLYISYHDLANIPGLVAFVDMTVGVKRDEARTA